MARGSRVTLQTVADRVGVSRMTVSNAFSRPDQLSSEVRDHVLAVATELGYVGPDPTARALARGRAGSVGVVLTDSVSRALSDDVASRFLSGVAEALVPTGLALSLLQTGERAGVLPVRDVALDGALVYSCEAGAPDAGWLMRRGLPVVFVDQEPRPGIACVNVDDRAGASTAASHLLDLGHVRVVLLTPTGDVGPGSDTAQPDSTMPAVNGEPAVSGYAAQQRLRGWSDTLSAAGVQPLTVSAPSDLEQDAYDSAMRFLVGVPRPSGVLCFSDVMAAGVLRAATDLDLAVPQDLSVVGFDDHAVAERTQPPLTTVRQDAVDKGNRAAALLVGMLSTPEPDRGAPEHQVLPTELIVRGSTAPVPTS